MRLPSSELVLALDCHAIASGGTHEEAPGGEGVEDDGEGHGHARAAT